MAATQLLLIKVSGSGARCRIGRPFRTCQRIKPAFAGWRAIFQRFWSDSSIMISALCWIDRGGHGEPGG